MAKKRKQYDDDDGRVIAPMNVDGMPWYTPHKADTPEEGASSEEVKLTMGEKVSYAAGVFKAILLISAVFIFAFLLFLLFCTNIWLK